MRYRKLSAIVLILLIISITFIGCGGGGGKKKNGSGIDSGIDLTDSAAEADASFLQLKTDNTIDVSLFNGKTIYTMFAAEPSGKPESNDSMAQYTWYLYTTAYTSKNLTATPDTSTLLKINQSNLFGRHIFGSGQFAVDKMMREEENKVLASGKSQLQKSAITKSLAPFGTNIQVGGSWNDVNILKTDKVGNNIVEAWTTIDTTCKYASSPVYIFAENNDTNTTTIDFNYYGDIFKTIYNTNHEKFGEENDVDQNQGVIIVFSSKLNGGVLGYFNSADKYNFDINSNPHSNQGDIFYVTTNTYKDASGNDISNMRPYLLGTLAHEFQHMIYFDQHYNRGVTTTYTWLNEALSQAAEYYNNYLDNHEVLMNKFLQYGASYGLSLTYWTDNNYGYGALFIRYLIDQFGDSAIKNMCSTDRVGISAVEAATGTDFNIIFKRFSRALVLSGTSTNTLYRFKTLSSSVWQNSDGSGLIPIRDVNGEIYTLTPGYWSGNGYPYSIWLFKWSGSFGTVKLSGNPYIGTFFGL